MTNEEALKILKYRSGWNLSIRDVNALDMAIKALEQEPCEDAPSAQPTQFIAEWQKDFREYINMLNIPRDDYKGIMEYINDVPSVQPKPIECEDAISREDVLKALPSVQPKTGHWISYWDEEARCYVYKCPECGNKQPFDTKHCWECGTKLSEISTGSESEKT